MAHADYDCCAVCDCKLDYNPNAEAKGRVCESCADILFEHGIKPTKIGIVDWLQHDATPAEFSKAMPAYCPCYYGGIVDTAVKEFCANYGIEVPNRRTLDEPGILRLIKDDTGMRWEKE